MEILIVDDENSMRTTMKYLLQGEGYDVRTASNGKDALQAIAEARPDLVLLDVMMPEMNGYATCREIRKRDMDLPILFLTALDSEPEELRGLNVGADDFVCKTASDGVLLARIAAVLRRTGRQTDGSSFAFGTWRVDPLAHGMSRGGDMVELTLREVEMLRWFAMHPNEVFSHDAMLTRFWGVEYDGGTATLTMQIARLRAKLGSDAALLVTVHGEGYALRT